MQATFLDVQNASVVAGTDLPQYTFRRTKITPVLPPQMENLCSWMVPMVFFILDEEDVTVLPSVGFILEF